jgi:hypothetical protein
MPDIIQFNSEGLWLTSDLVAQFDRIEALPTYGATICPLNPGRKAIIMKVVPTGLEVSDQGRYIFGGVVGDGFSMGLDRGLLVQSILGRRLGQS